MPRDAAAFEGLINISLSAEMRKYGSVLLVPFAVECVMAIFIPRVWIFVFYRFENTSALVGDIFQCKYSRISGVRAPLGEANVVFILRWS